MSFSILCLTVNYQLTICLLFLIILSVCKSVNKFLGSVKAGIFFNSWIGYLWTWYDDVGKRYRMTLSLITAYVPLLCVCVWVCSVTTGLSRFYAASVIRGVRITVWTVSIVVVNTIYYISFILFNDDLYNPNYTESTVTMNIENELMWKEVVKV
jgi:hypothetical protein